MLRPIPGPYAYRVACRLLGGLVQPMELLASMRAAAEGMGKAFQPFADELAKLRVPL